MIKRKFELKGLAVIIFILGLPARMKTERRNLKMTGISTYRNWDLGWNVKCIKFIR